MHFEVEHTTQYRYSVPVRLGEHLLRFQPPDTAGQRVLSCELRIDPLPVASEEGRDAWGNRIRRVRFRDETGHLCIHARLHAETLEPCPLPPEALPLPPDFGTGTEALRPYLQVLEDPARLWTWLQPLLASGETGAFLDALTRAVHSLYHCGVRLDGPPRGPAETLALGEGVCRDLAVLFMAACRQAGVPARFVSGYQQGGGTRERRYLHAWPEVFLPGQGWRGYDPTHGTLAGAAHLAVAAAPEPAGVTPVEGGYSFQGPELTSTLETDIRITTS